MKGLEQIAADERALARKRKPGRPTRTGKPSLERIEIRLTIDEFRAWMRCCGDKTLSEWLRDLANKAAARAR